MERDLDEEYSPKHDYKTNASLEMDGIDIKLESFSDDHKQAQSISYTAYD